MEARLIVQKYGGTSIATVEKIKKVAHRVMAARHQGHQVVVVVSAMGDTTDRLLAAAREVAADPLRRELDLRGLRAYRALCSTPPQGHPASRDCAAKSSSRNNRLKKLELPSKVWYKGSSPFVVANERRQALHGGVNPLEGFLESERSAAARPLGADDAALQGGSRYPMAQTLRPSLIVIKQPTWPTD